MPTPSTQGQRERHRTWVLATLASLLTSCTTPDVCTTYRSETAREACRDVGEGR